MSSNKVWVIEVDGIVKEPDSPLHRDAAIWWANVYGDSVNRQRAVVKHYQTGKVLHVADGTVTEEPTRVGWEE